MLSTKEKDNFVIIDFVKPEQEVKLYTPSIKIINIQNKKIKKKYKPKK